MASMKMDRLKSLMEDEKLGTVDEDSIKSNMTTDCGVSSLSFSTGDQSTQHSQCTINSDNGIQGTFKHGMTLSKDAEMEGVLSDQTTSTKTLQSEPTADTPHGRTVGELTSLDESFCPVTAVAKYPYKYMSSSPAASEEISQKYFATGLFWARSWTLFYVHPPSSVATKPLLFVPASEVRALLSTINTELGIELQFPGHSREPGFNVSFSACLRPRFLGICTSKDEFDKMQKRIPGSDFRVTGEESSAQPEDSRSFEAFAAKMDAALQATKNKSKSSKEKKKVDRVYQKEKWCSQLKRTQRYFGIRPFREANTKATDPCRIPGLSWAELQEVVDKRNQASAVVLPDLDVTQPTPYPFDNDVVFVCVDVESFERNHNLITEIGISTLDTRDLVNVPPGIGGVEWMGKIRARHFRIKEFTHLVNKDFIHGCAEYFEKAFGTSELISINEAPQVVASCFRPPFSSSRQTSTENLSHTKRNIIFVGHDTRNDIEYLRQVGYDLSNLSNLLEILDTADLFRALKYDNTGKGLGSILLELGIRGWNLHNAGNDAAYTLQALIGITFKGLAAKHERQAIFSEEQRQLRLEAMVKDAEEKIKDDEEEWNLADIDDDGGIPINNLEKPKAERAVAQANRGSRGGAGGRGGDSRVRGAGRGDRGHERRGSRSSRSSSRSGRGASAGGRGIAVGAGAWGGGVPLPPYRGYLKSPYEKGRAREEGDERVGDGREMSGSLLSSDWK